MEPIKALVLGIHIFLRCCVVARITGIAVTHLKKSCIVLEVCSFSRCPSTLKQGQLKHFLFYPESGNYIFGISERWK